MFDVCIHTPLQGSTADLAEEAAVAVEDTATQQQTTEEVATEMTSPKVREFSSRRRLDFIILMCVFVFVRSLVHL